MRLFSKELPMPPAMFHRTAAQRDENVSILPRNAPTWRGYFRKAISKGV